MTACYASRHRTPHTAMVAAGALLVLVMAGASSASASASLTAPGRHADEPQENQIPSSAPGEITTSSLSPRQVEVKVYVNEDLWKRTEEDLEPGGDVNKAIIEKVEKLFKFTNPELRKLDEGGFALKFDKTIQRLEKSDVKIRKTYIDRLDNNVSKSFSDEDVFSHTFTFQEAVQEMEKQERLAMVS